MDTIKFFCELFDYTTWANRRIIQAVRVMPSGISSTREETREGVTLTSRSLQILAHLLTTEREYFDRLSGKDSTGFNFWPELTIGECETLAESTSKAFYDLLSTGDEEMLEQIANYKTSEGVPHADTWRQLLTQVFFHSATHRGNIMPKLRESGFEPPQIDYIIYLREKA